MLYEIPAGFVGWVEIAFEEPDAPALPVDDGKLIIRIPESGKCRTSSPSAMGVATDTFVAYSEAEREALRVTAPGGGGMIWGQTVGTSAGQHGRKREKFFVGTEAQWNASVPAAVSGLPQEPTPGPLPRSGGA